MITLYHNPRCSKSRAALELLEAAASERQLPLQVVEYLKTPPDAQQLAQLWAELGGDIQQMLRPDEEAYAAQNLAAASPVQIFAAIAAEPRLLQRPLASYRGKAVIGRPPENVMNLFGEEAA